MSGQPAGAPLRFVDSHCHVSMAEDAAAQLERAREAGVAGFIVPGTNAADNDRVVRLAAEHSDVWAAVGYHPHDAKHFDAAAEESIRRLADEPRVVGIGEVGLDYHYDFSPREVQRDVLRRHIEIAREKGKPLIIHNRESTEDLLAIVREAGELRGVLHSFTESWEVARQFLDLGLYISFSGIVTFNSAEMLRETARRVPHDRVLIETDAPYLAPVPHRGRKNEPAYVVRVAELLASLWGMETADVARTTTANAGSLFEVTIGR
jgi:TatD DNase family protein